MLLNTLRVQDLVQNASSAESETPCSSLRGGRPPSSRPQRLLETQRGFCVAVNLVVERPLGGCLSELTPVCPRLQNEGTVAEPSSRKTSVLISPGEEEEERPPHHRGADTVPSWGSGTCRGRENRAPLATGSGLCPAPLGSFFPEAPVVWFLGTPPSGTGFR